MHADQLLEHHIAQVDQAICEGAVQMAQRCSAGARRRSPPADAAVHPQAGAVPRRGSGQAESQRQSPAGDRGPDRAQRSAARAPRAARRCTEMPWKRLPSRLHSSTPGPAARAGSGAKPAPSSSSGNRCARTVGWSSASSPPLTCTMSSTSAKAAIDGIRPTCSACADTITSAATTPDRRSGSILAPVCHCLARIIRGVRNDRRRGASRKISMRQADTARRFRMQRRD